jgi:hypothetical protein
MPLYLFQILEEEYCCLHSAELKPEVVTFPYPTQSGHAREITANLDCFFHPSHIKDPSGFIAELLRYSSMHTSGARISAISNIAPSDWTRISLIRALRTAFDQKSLDTLRRLHAVTQQAALTAGTAVLGNAALPNQPRPLSFGTLLKPLV